MSEATILLLDDDQTFCEVLARALRRRGFTVLAAQTIGEALALCEMHRPQYAVVDLKIAQESGLAAAEALLALLPGLRILMLTGYSSIATAVSAIKRGVYDYACKPLDADEILHKLGVGSDAPAMEAVADVPDQPTSVDRLEWEHIKRVLNEHDGNISATARSLGMHRRTLQRKLQKRPVRN
ncbi:MAG: response regulator [Pseudomonadota bacterium]|nr:response regulator [Pseudomonadota bacterium]